MSCDMCIGRHKLCNAKTGVGPTFTWSNEPWYTKNIARITKSCPEKISSVVEVLSCFFLKDVTNCYCHYCHYYKYHILSFWVFITIWVLEFCHNWIFEFCQNLRVLSPIGFLSFVTIWIILFFGFCHHFIFWVLSHFEFLSFVTVWVFKFCHNLRFWVWSWFDFLMFVTYWVFYVLSIFQFLSFVTV